MNTGHHPPPNLRSKKGRWQTDATHDKERRRENAEKTNPLTRSHPEPTIRSTNSTNITCPSDNDSIFQPMDHTSLYFRLSCGLDYPTSLGAADISTLAVPSMNACIELCAATNDCLGVSWEEESGRCVTKGKVGSSAEGGGTLSALKIEKPAAL